MRQMALIIGIVLLIGINVSAKNKQPNIVYILADDLGYGDLGCYGQFIINTPNIDRLCNEGMKFTQHYAGSTVCAPSRAALLTGQHTGNCYVRSNKSPELRPDNDDITIARYLKNAGYTTAMIGKSSTGCNTSVGQPNAKGFDLFFGYISHKQAHTYYPKYLYRNSTKIEFPGNGGSETWRGDTYSQDLFLEEAKKFISDEKDQPFFLFYASALPHAQMHVPSKFKEPYKGIFTEKPFSKGKNLHYGESLEPNATTAGMINRLDWEVGQIMEHLKVLGLEKNTIVMFSSDNGPHREGGRRPEFFKSSGSFRGIKRDFYEGGIRVPFIVKWPGVVEPSSVSEHISAFWDVLPTCLDITGQSMPKNIDGISFLPLLQGNKKHQKIHDYLYWEFYEQGGKQALRQGDWKAIKLDVIKNPARATELYNLKNDPGESENLAEQYPEKLKEMEALMKKAHSENEVLKFKTE